MNTTERLTPDEIESFADAAASLASDSTFHLLSHHRKPKESGSFTDVVELPNGKKVIIAVTIEDESGEELEKNE